jgi:hypothetical protein
MGDDLTLCFPADDALKIEVRIESGGCGEEGKVQQTADRRTGNGCRANVCFS